MLVDGKSHALGDEKSPGEIPALRAVTLGSSGNLDTVNSRIKHPLCGRYTFDLLKRDDIGIQLPRVMAQPCIILFNSGSAPGSVALREMFHIPGGNPDRLSLDTAYGAYR